MPADRFDAAYYDRFYGQPRTRVQGPAEVGRLAAMVVRLVSFAGGEISSVLDVGAGPGLWRDWFRKHHPDVHYRSTDVSAYACRTYGHERRDITTWRARETFDLVICQGVLPYLDRTKVPAAVENLATMCEGFLYLEAVTAHDLRHAVDRDATDGAMHGHPARSYRAALAPHFVQLGFGLWMKRDTPHTLYELEHGR